MQESNASWIICLAHWHSAAGLSSEWPAAKWHESAKLHLKSLLQNLTWHDAVTKLADKVSEIVMYTWSREH